MHVQNEIVVKWIHMVFYHDKFCYTECNLIFDDFLFFTVIQCALFWISVFPVL